MIGQPTSRVDGPVKVTGRATYAYEYWQDEPPLYGVVVTATIGRGRITEIDTSPAERSPGVRAVITHKNAPPQGARDDTIPWSYWRARPILSNEEISHYGEVVALVVATTLEERKRPQTFSILRTRLNPDILTSPQTKNGLTHLNT